MAVEITKLMDHHEVVGFDCGDAPLNRYLAAHALTNQKKLMIGATYVALDLQFSPSVLGYFTVAMANLAKENLPPKAVRGLPPYALPMVLLARLAVDKRTARKGLGGMLLAEAIRLSLHLSGAIGCRYILTEAYREKVGWYARFGFQALQGGQENGPVKMVLDLRTAQEAMNKTSGEP